MKTTHIDGRAILFENETCRKHGLMAQCNSCDRIIFEDEMTAQEFTGNGGYCKDCATPEIPLQKVRVKDTGNTYIIQEINGNWLGEVTNARQLFTFLNANNMECINYNELAID